MTSLRFDLKCLDADYIFDALKLGLCGGIAGIWTDLLFYGLDSYKVVQQAGKQPKLTNIFRGALPISVFGSGPSYGCFFLLYSPLREALTSLFGEYSSGVSVLISSVVCSVPSSICFVPADVIKKRLLLGEFSSVSEATSKILYTEGVAGLFLGWKVNLLRDVPFGVIKMGLYESIASLYVRVAAGGRRTAQRAPTSISSSLLTKEEAGVVGFASGAATALVTCPIDCVNTRIKSGEFAHLGVISTHIAIVKKDGIRALFRGLLPRTAMLGLGATVFWSSYASLRSIFSETKDANH